MEEKKTSLVGNNHTHLNSCAKEVSEHMEYIKRTVIFYSTYKTDNDSDLLKAERTFKSELKKLSDIANKHLG